MKDMVPTTLVHFYDLEKGVQRNAWRRREYLEGVRGPTPQGNFESLVLGNAISSSLRSK